MSTPEHNEPLTYLDTYRNKDIINTPTDESAQSKSLGERFEKLGSILENKTIPGELADNIFLVKNNQVSVLVAIGGINLPEDTEGSGRKNAYFRHYETPKNIVQLSNPELQNEGNFLPYPNILEFEAHSDVQTDQQIQNLLREEPEMSELLTTIYTFDAEGNKKKLVFLPEDVDDTRPSIFNSHLERRGVEGEYTDDDFKRIEELLTLFEKSLGN